MSVSHQFGGSWTDDKLERLRKYLVAYMTIFKGNERARHLTTYYVDAFAGTGNRTTRGASEQSEVPSLFTDATDLQDAGSYQMGSARIALEIPEPFDHYIFVDAKPEHTSELELLKDQYPHLAHRILIVNEDANTFLRRWCSRMNALDRAVVFLDPYGMSVDWQTVEAIAATEKIDMWLLFPLGMAVNRLLTRKGLPPPAWANALTRIFGTTEWREAFYSEPAQLNLFDEAEVTRDASFAAIATFFKRRLSTIFADVAPNHLTLRNSRNSPLFLLCFAAGNERGARAAIRIADDLLRS